MSHQHAKFTPSGRHPLAFRAPLVAVGPSAGVPAGTAVQAPENPPTARSRRVPKGKFVMHGATARLHVPGTVLVPRVPS